MQLRRERPAVKNFAVSAGGRIGRSSFLTIAAISVPTLHSKNAPARVL
jgi:hypothetical protein